MKSSKRMLGAMLAGVALIVLALFVALTVARVGSSFERDCLEHHGIIKRKHHAQWCTLPSGQTIVGW